MRIDSIFLESVVKDSKVVSGEFPKTVSFAVDSRQIVAGDIFIALPGAKQDGHDFLKDVIALPIAGIMIEAKKKDILATLDLAALKNKIIITVPDTLAALIAMAVSWREKNQPYQTNASSTGP